MKPTLAKVAGLLFPAIVILVVLDQWPFLTDTFSRGQVVGRDAYNFWLAGRLAADGQIEAIYDPAAFAEAVRARLGPAAGLHVFPYPPPALLGFALLGMLPYGLALVLWSLAGGLVYLLAISPERNRAALVLALLAPMTLVNIAIGQNGLLTAALFIGGLRLAPTRPLLAGILIGMLAYKPFMALLLPLALLLQRQWLVIASATATLLLACLLPIVVWGPEIWTSYFREAVPFQRQLLEHGTGLAQLMKPTVFMGARILGAPVNVSYYVQAITGLLALALTLSFLCRKRMANEGQTLLVLSLATALMTPYIHIYDLTLIAAALIVMARDSGEIDISLRDKIFLGSLWALPVIAIFTNAIKAPIAPLIMLGALFWLTQKNPVFAPARTSR